MTTWTITFYRWMLWWMEYGVVIARSTGRDPKRVQRQLSDIANIQHTIDLLEIQE
jgi:hypothetical protein